MAGDLWTEELTAKVCKLWDLDMSALEIANALGLSRNAVIGKIHRLRNAGHKFARKSLTKAQLALDAATKQAAKERARKAREAAALDRAAVRGGTIARMVVKAEPKNFAAPPVILDASFAKPWTEREFGECAYPIAGEGAETVSCCAKTGGQTYCAGHHKVMFQPRQPHQRKADRRLINHLTKRYAA